MSFRFSKNKLRVLIIIPVLIFTFSSYLHADKYKFINKRVQKIKSTKTTPFSKTTLSEVVYTQDEEIALLRQQLLKSKAEQKKLKKELTELKKSFERFKNYYFRRY